MSVIKDLFSRPKMDSQLTLPPSTPRRPDSGLDVGTPNFQSLISTGSSTGLKRKASTQKRSLIGGS